MGYSKGPHHRNKRPTAFGAKLATERERAKMDQQELAVMLHGETGENCNAGRISEWEQGQRIPNPTQLAGLKKLLDPKGHWPAPVKFKPEPVQIDVENFELVS